MSKYPMRVFEPGQVIFNEGDAGDCAYLLRKGRVELSRDLFGRTIVLAELSPASMFGELAILGEGGRRTAKAVAVDQVQALEVDRTNFKEFTDSSPQIMQQLLSLMAERLKATTEKAAAAPPVYSSLALLFELFVLHGQTTLSYPAVVNFFARTTGSSPVYLDMLMERLAELKLVALAKDDSGDGYKAIGLPKAKNLAQIIDGKLASMPEDDGIPLMSDDDDE